VYSSLLRTRSDLGNPSGFTTFDSSRRRVRPWGARKMNCLRNQSLTAVLATRLQHSATILRGHALPEAVRALATNAARLVCETHGTSPGRVAPPVEINSFCTESVGQFPRGADPLSSRATAPVGPPSGAGTHPSSSVTRSRTGWIDLSVRAPGGGGQWLGLEQMMHRASERPRGWPGAAHRPVRRLSHTRGRRTSAPLGPPLAPKGVSAVIFFGVCWAVLLPIVRRSSLVTNLAHGSKSVSFAVDSGPRQTT
jgi:hypothetical protein